MKGLLRDIIMVNAIIIIIFLCITSCTEEEKEYEKVCAEYGEGVVEIYNVCPVSKTCCRGGKMIHTGHPYGEYKCEVTGQVCKHWTYEEVKN